jgi:hypothetical protein
MPPLSLASWNSAKSNEPTNGNAPKALMYSASGKSAYTKPDNIKITEILTYFFINLSHSNNKA